MRQLKSKVARYQMNSPSGTRLAMHSGTSPTLFFPLYFSKERSSHPGVTTETVVYCSFQRHDYCFLLH